MNAILHILSSHLILRFISGLSRVALLARPESEWIELRMQRATMQKWISDEIGSNKTWASGKPGKLFRLRTCLEGVIAAGGHDISASQLKGPVLTCQKQWALFYGFAISSVESTALAANKWRQVIRSAMSREMIFKIIPIGTQKLQIATILTK